MKKSIATLSCASGAFLFASLNPLHANPDADSKPRPALQEASVALPWQEFKKLWEGTLPRQENPHPDPPHVVLESRFVVDWKSNPAQVLASWVVENFDVHPQWIRVLPADAILGPETGEAPPHAIKRDKQGLSILAKESGRGSFQSLLLAGTQPGPEGRQILRFPVGSAAVNTVEIRNIPDDCEVRIPNAVVLKSTATSRTFVLPPGATEAKIDVLPIALEKAPMAEPAELIIPRMNAITRIVKDGSLLTEIQATLQANLPGTWKITLPAGADLLRSTVQGKTVRPLQSGQSLEIPFDPSQDPGTIKTVISFTQKIEDFDPVGGGLTVELPQTDEFIDSVEWELHLPAGYTVRGMESPAEILPTNPGEPLRLRQQLVRGTAVKTEIFYSKGSIE